MSKQPAELLEGTVMVQEENLVTEEAEIDAKAFRLAIEEGDTARAVELADQLTRRDLREALLTLDDEQLTTLHRGCSEAQLAAIVGELHPEDAAAVLQRLSDGEAAGILDEFASDDAADIIQAIKAAAPARLEPILVEMDRRGDVQPLLAHLPDTAGGIMTTDFLAVRPDATAEEAIRALQQRARNGDFRGYVYATGEDGRLVGVVPIYRLVLVEPATPIEEFMVPEPVSVRGTDDQQDVARVFQERRFLAVPVVDIEDRLIGVITADDVLDVQVEEATEDMFKMAGVGVKEHAFSPVLESAGRRVPWLSFNMVWAFAGAAIIGVFQGTLEKAAFLAVFMPMIAGQCGNAGIQTATIVVRSMALGEINGHVTFRLLRKEWVLGMIKGVIFGSVLGVVAWLWKDNAALGLIAGAAMFLNMLVASTAGVVVPLTLRRVGVDPATIAGVFDTMLTDFMGFLIYLGLATLFISQLT
jgi:magnesium transporter